MLKGRAWKSKGVRVRRVRVWLVRERGNRYRVIRLVKKIGREGGNDTVREKCLCTMII